MKENLGDLLKNNEEEAQKLYRKIVNERNATPEEEARMMELTRRHCVKVLDTPAEKIFKTMKVKAELPSYSRLLDSKICTKCGEKVMETKAVERDGVFYCADCGGQGYNQLDWSGIHRVKGSN